MKAAPQILTGLLAFVCAVPAWTMSLAVGTTTPPPVAVGFPVHWEAAASESPGGEVWYRYRVRAPQDSGFKMVRDFSPGAAFDWMPAAGEGTYEVEITAKNRATGEITSVVQQFPVVSRVTTGEPVITPTNNELVYLYSAPPCPEGSRISVTFFAADTFPQATPAQDCAADRSLNVYLAGLRAQTTYTVRHIVTAPDGTVSAGPDMELTTNELRQNLAATRVLREPAGPAMPGVLFQNRVFEPSVATDLQGNIVWYYSETVPYLTRPEPGGYFFALFERHGSPDSEQVLRQIDLAGNTVWETNAARINEQLQNLGKHPVTSFHHEARRLPDGRIMVLAGTERLLTGVQGEGETDVIGDAILVLNSDLEVEWFWDAFEHLDVTRKAVLDEKCTVGAGGCPVFRLAESANDWLHGNSLSLAPDGNIIYSSRHQDWAMKIDYADGNGSGSVIWRLGRGGDFQLVNGSDNDWFSHQHDINYVPCQQGMCLLLFDNANTSFMVDETTHSRGQMYYLDEAARTANLLLNIDLGDYALALGTAQLLDNGNYHFNLGWDTQGGRSQALEYDRQGNLVRQLQMDTQQYRSRRMRDMYTP